MDDLFRDILEAKYAEIERNRAAIAELVAALSAILNSSVTVLGLEEYAAARAAVAEHEIKTHA